MDYFSWVKEGRIKVKGLEFSETLKRVLEYVKVILTTWNDEAWK